MTKIRLLRPAPRSLFFDAEPAARRRLAGHGPCVASGAMDFGVMFFSSADEAGAGGKYDLLLNVARFADAHGFSCVWTPERHFHAFGGLFPNPSVTSAAIAAITKNVAIRAGSVVSPLHSVLRI